MSARPHLLLVDDEASIREPLGAYLQRAGFRVSEAGSAADARKVLAGSAIELVVLDIMMPGEDGLSLCRSIREQGELPVILLTARTEETDRIVGLEMGADDYVLKPFSPRELVARIKAILRRSDGRPGRRSLEAGAVRLDTATRRVWAGDDEVALTATEFNLLAALMSASGRVVERAELMASAWGQADYAASRTVDVHVAQLRAKLGERCPIETVRGVGYRVRA
jgi:two-component system OmpR family response regulator